MEEARAAIDEGLAAVAEHPDIRFAGYLQDAQKEYAEARLTEVIVDGRRRVPSPDALGVEDAPYLNGMAEAIGKRAGGSSTCCAPGASTRVTRSWRRWRTCTGSW